MRKCAEWTARRDAADRPAERPARRDARASGRLRRVARRAGRADDPVLRPLRRAAGRSAEPVDVAAVRGDDSRRRDLRARLGRRQGPGVHALQGGRSAPEAERQPAGEHEVPDRGRRGSRQRQPRQLHQGPQGPAEGRRRGDLRLADVRSRHPVDLLRPARPRLLPDRPARQQVGSAFRIVRRRGGESGDGARASARADEGQERPHQDRRLLRRCGGAAAGGARRVGAAAVQREEVQGRNSARRSCSAKPASRRSSASGRVRRSR